MAVTDPSLLFLALLFTGATINLLRSVFLSFQFEKHRAKRLERLARLRSHEDWNCLPDVLQNLISEDSHSSHQRREKLSGIGLTTLSGSVAIHEYYRAFDIHLRAVSLVSWPTFAFMLIIGIGGPALIAYGVTEFTCRRIKRQVQSRSQRKRAI